MLAGLLAYHCPGLPEGVELTHTRPGTAGPPAARGARAAAQASSVAATSSNGPAAATPLHYHSVLSMLSGPHSAYCSAMAASPAALVVGTGTGDVTLLDFSGA